MKKIVVTFNSYDLLPDQIERLNKLGEVIIYKDKLQTPDEWLRRCQDADIICTGKFGLKEKLYELKDVFISLPFVAVGWIDRQKIKERNITVANCPGCNKFAVSEWAIGMMINVMRQLPQYINMQIAPSDTVYIGLAGKRVTVLGTGNVGSRVATVCTALGMQVTVFKRGDDLLRSVHDADVVIDCLGANDSTYGLLGKDFFDALKRDSYFITVTSPVIWDVEVMLQALDTGRLAGVATDTASIQVGDTNDPLYKNLSRHKKIFATPHIAYRSDITTRISNDMMIDNVEAWLKGKPINLV